MKKLLLALLLASCVTANKEIDQDVVSKVPSAERSVLHFWATWCESCKEELTEIDSDINDLFRHYPDMVFVLVSVDIDVAAAKKYLYENHPSLLKYSFYCMNNSCMVFTILIRNL